MKIDPRIFYLIVVPDWRPEDATPLQGFAPSLCQNEWMIRAIAALPSTIYDLSDRGRRALIQRRMTGGRTIHWHGQTPRVVLSSTPPEETPFWVVLVGEHLPLTDYMDWSKRNGSRPTIVAEQGGHLSFSDFTLEGLRDRLLAVCDLLPTTVAAEDVVEAKTLIAQWKKLDDRDLGYKVGGHNNVAPNVYVLSSMGFENVCDGPMKVSFDIQPHVDQIVRTTRSIYEERERLDVRRLARFLKPTFDLNLFAPAIFPDVLNMNVPASLGHEERERFIVARRMVQDQTGYSYQSRTDAHAYALLGIKQREVESEKPEISPHPLFRLRRDELWLGTACMVAFAVSEASAVARLPNAVNRTAGVVHNFAEHYRSRAPVTRKRLRGFQEVQNSLARAVPEEFIDLIRESRAGVRIVADAHLEWLDVDGLPRGVRKDVTRIPVTPGNSFVDYVSAHPPVLLTLKDFEHVLVINAMKDDDEPLRGVMQQAIAAFEDDWENQIRIDYVDVGSEEDLIAALNNFDGSLVIFDGHGGHAPGDAGKLYLKDTPVDVWMLKDRVKKVPPIILLSACDTHAADRNHATAANGFLSLGTRTVLGSVFPLKGFDAAVFIARLLYRVAAFLPDEIGRRRRPITWAELVSGMLRMLLLTDYLRHLMAVGLISEEVYIAVHEEGNRWINLPVPDPFERVDQLLEQRGLDPRRLRAERALAVANSSVISYLRLGRPETILVVREEMLPEAHI